MTDTSERADALNAALAFNDPVTIIDLLYDADRVPVADSELDRTYEVDTEVAMSVPIADRLPTTADRLGDAIADSVPVDDRLPETTAEFHSSSGTQASLVTQASPMITSQSR